MSEDKVEKVFQVSGQAQLIVKNIRGGVQITPGPEGEIQVAACKHTDSGNAERTVIELTQAADGTVQVEVHFPDGSIDWLFGKHPCKVDLTIQAPLHCDLKVNTVSADATAGGFEGKFSFATVSGDLHLHDLKGSLRIHSVSGDVHGETISAPLDLDTVSGDAKLDDCSLISIKAKTVSGDLRLHTALGEGPYQFNSVSGDVCLVLPPGTHCTGDLHSVSGDLLSAFPVSRYSRSSGSRSLEVQGGGVDVSMHSVSGDLSLDCDGIPPVPQAVSTADGESRREVLERLEHGEISVEEALSKLGA